jgi:hypothetical protein
MNWTAVGQWLAKNDKQNIYDNYRQHLEGTDPNALSQLEEGWNSVKQGAMDVEGGRKRRKTTRRRKASRKRRV